MWYVQTTLAEKVDEKNNLAASQDIHYSSGNSRDQLAASKATKAPETRRNESDIIPDGSESAPLKYSRSSAILIKVRDVPFLLHAHLNRANDVKELKGTRWRHNVGDGIIPYGSVFYSGTH